MERRILPLRRSLSASWRPRRKTSDRSVYSARVDSGGCTKGSWRTRGRQVNAWGLCLGSGHVVESVLFGEVGAIGWRG
jgi:hypothetical protein